MNGIYRSIWNETTGTCVATSEHGSSAGKKTSSRSIGRPGYARFAIKSLAASLLLAFGSTASALPSGGAVSAGAATIASGNNSTTITQSSQNTAINWQSFSIAQGESVRFNQPNSNSVALNRVIGSDPSSIFGTLSANGKVFLVNPSGIFFAAGASVNVAGLVASTQNISDSNFMAGNYHFVGTSDGAVVNQGSINADGGYVAMLGANVSNQGTISARLGSVALASGNAITLDLAGDGLLNVVVSQGTANALVQNGGVIRADGGQVLLTSRGAGSVLQSAVNNTGVIHAQSIENRAGSIMLLGDMQGGTVNVGGTLDTAGAGTGSVGGDISVTGHHVGLFGAQLNASGDAGGGTVLIGGNYQGANLTLANASATYMSTDSSINANANANGNGGTVVLWANDTTRAYGNISATGGAQSGNGGLIETSAHSLDVQGIHVSTSAPHGVVGNWLLDPADVTITGAASSPSFSGGNPNVFAPASGVSSANVNVGDITTALATTGVTINTANTGASGAGTGNITVSTAITWLAPTTLTLNAANNVNVNAAITGTDGSLVANAIGGSVLINAAITTTTGGLTFIAKNDVTLAAATTITTGNLTAVAGGNVNISAASTVTTGDMIFRGDNDGTGPGPLAGTVVITCGLNCLTVTTGNLNIRFNPVSYATTGAEIIAYDGNLTGAGVLDARAWVYGNAQNKVYDGTTAAIVNGFKPDVTAVLPPVALGAVAGATFDTKDVGVNKLVTFNSAFTDPVYALFAPFGSAPGVGTARANITQAPLNIAAIADNKTYNGIAYAGGNGVTYTSFVGGETPAVLGGVLSFGGTSQGAINVGGYTITPAGLTSLNYAITFTSGPLTINPAGLTVTASNVAKSYGQTPVLSAFTTAGLVNGETVGSVTLTSPGTVATASVAGSPYVIVPSNATGGTFTPANYTIAYVNGILTVNPVALTVTASNVAKSYGQTPVLSAFTTAGLVNGETVGSVTLTSPGTVATASVAGSPYVIVPSNATGGTFTPANYTIAYVNGILTVIPVPLSITANPDSKVYNGIPYSGGNGVVYSAFVNGEGPGALAGALSYAGSSQGAVVPGIYPIVPQGFTSTNYTISYFPNPLTITPKPLIGSITAADKVYDANNIATITSRTLAGVVGADVVSYSGGSATFDTPLVGIDKTVTGVGLGLTGASAGNYTVNSVALTTADITSSVVPGETIGVVPPVLPVEPPVPPIVVTNPPVTPQLATLVPPLVIAPAAPPPVAKTAVPVLAPVAPPVDVYVAPPRPRKQDRN